jgi:uncharacterized protein
LSRHVLLLILLLALATGIRAERADQLPVPLPDSHVSDLRGLLKADTRAELDRLATTLDQAGRGQLAFVVVDSVDSADPRRFATDVFNRWGVGDRTRNDGTLFLLAKRDRAAEIVLGDGIDNAANRRHAERVMQNAMVPRFRGGDYDQGLVAGATQLLQTVYAVDLSRPAERAESGIANGDLAVPAALLDSGDAPMPLAADSDQPVQAGSVEYRHAATTAPPASPAGRGKDERNEAPTGALAIGLSILAAISAVLVWLLQKILRMLWWFTGSRWFTRKCGACGSGMQLLPEHLDDHHLKPSQLTEERLKSIDHRVFKCPRCGKIEQIARRAWFTRYSDCQSCHSRALSSVSTTLTPATRYSTGLAEVTETCQNCNQVRTEQRVLPVLPPPSSSSSSSGSSFGGGRSSGGGASGRW